ncbi:tripartite tricarboxylate transporter TctB family protein [Prauserella flavalba]|uniref:tripartite tricarboxylate transporter TctB family protein n=1 Tax=Prauserella flavalba TaxID=1477506 RepID=UPI0036F15D59
MALVFGVGAAFLSTRLSLGSFTDPAPGLWPFIVSALIIVTAAALLFTEDSTTYERWDRRTLRVVAGLTSLAVFVVLFQLLGFLLAAGLLLLVWMRFIGHESWRTALPLAVGGAVVLHVLFTDIFGVPFPPGLFVWG